MELVDSPYAAAAGADALLVVTEWREFRSPDFDRLRAVMRTPVVFDGRNLFDPAVMRVWASSTSASGAARAWSWPNTSTRAELLAA